ncbi:hypothetical protein RchiOBHm_Chr7g0230631 [Rosa chinensis]|uniref:Uncharacterized protein n=1 Tax=Rosa chinensis TaxID=74649 RepID=A0A2P6PFH0_ROSCH|nr:hypothetical protein RchiOBHm_Chr7g0230631 [Rosa chinensis]
MHASLQIFCPLLDHISKALEDQVNFKLELVMVCLRIHLCRLLTKMLDSQILNYQPPEE